MFSKGVASGAKILCRTQCELRQEFPFLFAAPQDHGQAESTQSAKGGKQSTRPESPLRSTRGVQRKGAQKFDKPAAVCTLYQHTYAGRASTSRHKRSTLWRQLRRSHHTLDGSFSCPRPSQAVPVSTHSLESREFDYERHDTSQMWIVRRSVSSGADQPKTGWCPSQRSPRQIVNDVFCPTHYPSTRGGNRRPCGRG